MKYLLLAGLLLHLVLCRDLNFARYSIRRKSTWSRKYTKKERECKINSCEVGDISNSVLKLDQLKCIRKCLSTVCYDEIYAWNEVMKSDSEEEIKPLKRQRKKTSESIALEKSTSTTTTAEFHKDISKQKKPLPKKSSPKKSSRITNQDYFSSVNNKAKFPYFLPNGSPIPLRNLGRCPVCTFDMNFLHGTTPQTHINQCLDLGPMFEKGYCSSDSSCSSSNIRHYRDYKHDPEEKSSSSLNSDLSENEDIQLHEQKTDQSVKCCENMINKEDRTKLSNSVEATVKTIKLDDKPLHKLEITLSPTKFVQTRISSYFNSNGKNKTAVGKREELNCKTSLLIEPEVTSNTYTAVNKPMHKTKSKPTKKKKEPPKRKECPFYKKIPGTGITVDAFRYGDIHGCTAYFLSHFHSDHYGGLSNKFNGKLYCSKITANLVISHLHVDACKVVVLPMLEHTMVENVNVVLLDANHCPGSVMFLLEFQNGKRVFHVGDFRADVSMFSSHAHLSSGVINTLYLDTTYCDPKYMFPCQHDVIECTVKLARKYYHEHTLFVCGTYSIGKERVFKAIARALNMKIGVSKDKMKLLSCIEDEELDRLMTLDYDESQLHILAMGGMNVKKLHDHLHQHRSRGYKQLVAFKPTGWTFSSEARSLDHIKPIVSSNVTIFGVPYSEHSSFEELKWFVEMLKPQNIIPTVNIGTKKSRDAMEKHFRTWMT